MRKSNVVFARQGPVAVIPKGNHISQIPVADFESAIFSPGFNQLPLM
jgi:hypothetical protein